MVERLWTIQNGKEPLHHLVYKSMFRDPDANVSTSLQAECVASSKATAGRAGCSRKALTPPLRCARVPRFLRKRDRMHAIDKRLTAYLAFVDRCIVKFGRPFALFGTCKRLHTHGHKPINGVLDAPDDPDAAGDADDVTAESASSSGSESEVGDSEEEDDDTGSFSASGDGDDETGLESESGSSAAGAGVDAESESGTDAGSDREAEDADDNAI